MSNFPTVVFHDHLVLSSADSGINLKADGTCVVDIFPRAGVVSDTTSFLQISRAAEKVYGNCIAVGGRRTQGGWINNLGEMDFVISLA